MPPSDSFCWVAKQYVTIEGAAGTATVISDNVNVRPASSDGNPLHSSVVVGTLNKGDKLKIQGEENNGFIKINPPSFATVWVSSDFIKVVGSDIEAGKTVEPAIDVNSAEAKFLQQYKTIEKMVKTEMSKPLMSQDFSKIKPALDLIAANAEAGKAARLAQYTLKRIADSETALRIQKELTEQEKKLLAAKQNISNAAKLRESELPGLGKYAVIGRFQVLAIYGQQTRYKILDSQGSIICTAVPEGAAASADLNKFMNKKVGLIGSIEANPETSGALVKFTEIVELE